MLQSHQETGFPTVSPNQSRAFVDHWRINQPQPASSGVHDNQFRNRSAAGYTSDQRARGQDGHGFSSRPTSLHIAHNQSDGSLQSPPTEESGGIKPVFQHQTSSSSVASRPDSRRSVSSGSRPPSRPTSRPCSRPGSATSGAGSSRQEINRQDFHRSSPDFFKPFQSLKNPGTDIFNFLKRNNIHRLVHIILKFDKSLNIVSQQNKRVVLIKYYFVGLMNLF